MKQRDRHQHDHALDDELSERIERRKRRDVQHGQQKESADQRTRWLAFAPDEGDPANHGGRDRLQVVGAADCRIDVTDVCAQDDAGQRRENPAQRVRGDANRRRRDPDPARDLR